ncbi:hypothetical protein [Chryseobacterium daeguense]|uniref:hypothetical protein n=1 Tax=Chryseobacterium daeguense TaxID=412438 RepID=UPI0012DCA7D7|nr:hypothetical protein [Chryseobacterium daeguense]
MIVHFILSGETLESISEEIKLENPKYLKEFHNSHCAKEDIIQDQLIPRKKLLIPDSKRIKEYNSRNDAPFKDPKVNPDLPFRPENFSKIFSVINKEVEESEFEKKGNVLLYTVSLKWVEKKENFHIFHIFKNNFSNEHGSMMSDLASESIRALNPVVVKTDEKGNLINVSLKHETINNFGVIKENLIDFFPDKYAGMYLDEFEFAVLNKEVFNERMKEDIFIKSYFASLRNTFKNGKLFLKQTIGEENIPIEVIQKIQNADYREEIILEQKNESENDKDFTAKYILSAETGLVKNIEINHIISRYGVKNTTFFSVEELA